MVLPQRRRLVVDGVHSEVAGSGAPVVLTHDGLLHSESWDAQVEGLATDRSVARWDRRGYGRSPRPSAPFSSVEDLAAVVRAVPELPALPRLGEIAAPTLIVVGEHDIPDVHAHSGALEAGVPGATRVVLTGCGHLPHLEAPAAFNRLVHEFLAA